MLITRYFRAEMPHFMFFHRKGRDPMSAIKNVPEIFGSDVFTEATMKECLAPEDN